MNAHPIKSLAMTVELLIGDEKDEMKLPFYSLMMISRWGKIKFCFEMAWSLIRTGLRMNVASWEGVDASVGEEG